MRMTLSGNTSSWTAAVSFKTHVITATVSDNAMYVSNGTAVYQSTDDGVTWTHVFDISEFSEWKCRQALKVANKDEKKRDTDDFWLVEKEGTKDHYQLRRFNVDSRNSHVTLLNVTIPAMLSDCVQYGLHEKKIAYDGNWTIFVPCSASVHTWLVTGQYDRQLVSLATFTDNNEALCVAPDIANHILYVGQKHGGVIAYNLLYYYGNNS